MQGSGHIPPFVLPHMHTRTILRHGMLSPMLEGSCLTFLLEFGFRCSNFQLYITVSTAQTQVVLSPMTRVLGLRLTLNLCSWGMLFASIKTVGTVPSVHGIWGGGPLTVGPCSVRGCILLTFLYIMCMYNFWATFFLQSCCTVCCCTLLAMPVVHWLGEPLVLSGGACTLCTCKHSVCMYFTVH